MRRSANVFLIAIPLLVVIMACGDQKAGIDRWASNPGVKVVTTLPLFADFAREIGGERIAVFALLPPGSDPHTYEPAPRHVQRVTEADIAFANGLDLEPAAIKVIKSNLSAGSPLFELAKVAEEAGVERQGADPHLWMDIGNAREYARIIRDALAQVDRNGASEYAENYRTYMAELDRADQYVRGKILGIPENHRKLVTTHSAFAYLARYLGLEVAAFVVPGPAQEPSPEDLAELERVIKEEKVPAVFSEPQVSAESRLLEQVAAAAGVPVCTLYSDSLDDQVSSYLELMRFNARELARCLGGEDGA